MTGLEGVVSRVLITAGTEEVLVDSIKVLGERVKVSRRFSFPNRLCHCYHLLPTIHVAFCDLLSFLRLEFVPKVTENLSNLC